MKRGSGVFLNLSSLPGKYGIGGFGREAKAFIDLLRSMGMGWWQTLPLCPVGEGNSPYSSVSAFALNPLYADPDTLREQGLLTNEETKSARAPGSPYTVDYAWAKEKKEQLLRLAYARFDGAGLEAFRQEHVLWLEDYAAFQAGKRANAGAPWWEWTVQGSEADRGFYCFEQFILFGQWASVLRYAEGHGVSLLGDMPIYVSRDSADFFAHQELFLADASGNLTEVAGVPPDYFAKDGQLWGNPLYNWEAMQQDGYRWWIERIRHSLRLFHAVRIDHFRGFYRFWAVDAKAETARNGVWRNGPGMDLFRRVNDEFDHPPIIAEDLGTSEEGLIQFLSETGYPGMRVMQFGFTSPDSSHVPYRYPENCVAYTGTHDNDTMLGWLWAIPMDEKMRLLRYCRCENVNWGDGGPKSEVIRAIITTLWQSAAALAIVPVQDLCGYGTDTRMNIPGQAENNWRFRMTREALNEIDRGFYLSLNETYGRSSLL